jgi:hypothetical protein
MAPGHDIAFGLGLANFAKDAEAVAQNVKTRLLLQAGEWFLDAGAGVPYLRDIMVKPANVPLAQSIIKRRILETEGVASIEQFDLTFDPNTRRLTVSATVKTIYEDQTQIRVNLE